MADGSGYVVAGSAMFMAAVVSITGWLIGSSVTGNVETLRVSIENDIVKFQESVKATNSELKLLNRGMSELTKEVIETRSSTYHLNLNVLDHEERIRKLERGR